MSDSRARVNHAKGNRGAAKKRSPCSGQLPARAVVPAHPASCRFAVIGTAQLGRIVTVGGTFTVPGMAVWAGSAVQQMKNGPAGS